MMSPTNHTSTREFLNQFPLVCNTTANQTETFKRWTAGDIDLDFGPCVFKDSSSPSFWTLAFLVTISTVICACRWRGLRVRRIEGCDLGTSSSVRRKRFAMRGCIPDMYPMPRPRALCGAIICAFYLFMAVFTGLMVLLTTWRLTIFFIQLTFPVSESLSRACLVYLPDFIFFLVVWVVLFTIGYFIVKVHLGFFIELCRFHIRQRPEQRVEEDVELGSMGDACPPPYNDGGWERVHLRA